MTSTTRRKLLLINPAIQLRKGFLHEGVAKVMPLSLGIVAALTPAHWDVELLDESFEQFEFRPADLVAFTSFTPNAPRAYEIAAVYRKAGIHTVIGGSHASTCPEEAGRYVDTVVTGEAEGAWPALIADFEAGTLKPLYRGGICEIKAISKPRRDIFKYPYIYDLVQTSRGCPMGCDFCSVTHLGGKSYRERDVEEVLDELETTTRPLLFFIDDNLVNHKKGADERAIRLFKGMVGRGINKYWFSQAALNFADNDEVLYWARKSGCVMILIGIEAETVQALKDTRKNLNLKRGVDSYNMTFRKIHRHGIGILAAMIFGMENDSKEDLRARRDFIRNSSVDSYQCTILTPLPGTVLYDRMKSRNRIVLRDYPSDWQHYHCMLATSDTATMDHREIDAAMNDIWMSLYNKEAMRRKMFRTLWNTRSMKTAYWAYGYNHSYGRMFLEGVFDTYEDGVDRNFEWKNRSRPLFLKLTDYILMLFYKTTWKKTSRYFAGKQ